MMRLRFLLLAAFLGVIAAFSCSNKTSTPITPSDTGIDSSLPVVEFSGDETNHSLLGMWNAQFNLDSLEVTILQERASGVHLNVTSLIIPEIEIISYNPVAEVINVDVKIINPYTVDAYDVRLIIYTDAVGHRLQNDNGWTPLYDIPGGLPINPFTTFAKSVPGKLFEGETEHIENLRVLLPGGNPNVTFAIDASYPDNCLEPHKIGSLSQGPLYDEAGSSTMLRVGVYDHQNNADSVGLYLPEITGTSELVYFNYIGYSGWELELFNNTIASMGQYDGFLVASSSDSGTLVLYDDVKITISTYDGGWARTWGGIDSDSSYDVAYDASGYIYVSGQFNETVDFDPGPGEDYHSSNGSGDAYLSKFDIHGNFVWALSWGGTDNVGGKDVDIDDSGNIYVAGLFRGVVDFDPGPGEANHFSNGKSDVYLSKFDSDGNLVWVLKWGGVFSDKSDGLVVDDSGNVWVTGSFESEVDFDPGPEEYWLRVNDNSMDIYLSKFDNNGDLQWALSWGSEEGYPVTWDSAQDVTADASGNIYVSGFFNDIVDFDPAPDGVDKHISHGEEDNYLSKFDTTGDFLWARTWGGPGSEWESDLATDVSGDIYVTGRFYDTVDFDPGPGVDEYTSNGWYEAFLSKFDMNGNFIWARTWGGSSSDHGMDCDTDYSGNIFVTGPFREIVDFDPGPGVDEHKSIWDDDIFLSKFNTSGDFFLARTWGGSGTDYGRGVALDPSGNIYITGRFDESVDFDPGPGEDIHTTAGDLFYADPFLMKLLPNGYWE